MTNIVTLHSDKAALRLELGSWWARESNMLGRTVTTVLGVGCIVGAGLLVAVFFMLPAEIMERMGMGGYLLAFGLVSVLFGMPMLVCGVLILAVAKTEMMTPRSVALMLIVAVPLATGTGLWANQLREAGISAQARSDEMARSLSIRDFVSKMDLQGSEYDDMLARVRSMSDEDLCKAAVLSLDRCRGVFVRE